ncbi:unnamed protein product [Brachionus calyciflorus]|uniref:CBM21 domain-containing protein n=1 Tax=Brachionus calyciflorus TaxID=104777 RepID=A0A814CN98_9BILA|nr:unnamed protein product [Brachionus calyciflorus]
MNSKTQPRPILKKSNRSPNRVHPHFFSGNETMVEEEDEDEKACHIRFQAEKEMEQSSESSSKKCGLKKSCLKSHTNKIADQKQKSAERSKRKLSNVYIFHSREIDNQIMKFLLRSFNNFLQDFKSSIITEFYDDSQLFGTFKNKFVSKLKEFLINGESLLSDQLPACNLGVTLSEPLLSDIENFRNKINQEHLVSSCSEQMFNIPKENFLDKLDLDKNDNIIKKNAKLENSVFGSLPTTSFFESYASETNLKGNLLLKSIRPKPLRTNQDSLLLAHVHEAFTKKRPKEKSILSTATNQKKAVRFADTFGLELEKVKIISNNSFVDVFSQQYKHNEEEEELIGSNTAESSPFLVLIPLFSCRKIESLIRLDDFIYDYENKIIKCIVKVRNLSYDKHVYARITINNWKSFYDLDAIYIRSDKNSSKDKINSQQLVTYDYFGFCIVIPEKTNLPVMTVDSKPFDDCTLRVEFALCCIQNGSEFWDNNCGDNYKFQCFYNKRNYV